jgi:23S rRNA (pseudouridine1915-N3)-methyltransferase
MLRLVLIAAANRQPGWVDEGYAEYAKRLRGRCTLELKVVALARRTPSTPPSRAIEDESERLLKAAPAGAHVVALDERGTRSSTAELAERLAAWERRGAPVAFLIGGPDGLSPVCFERAAETWALSPLTLPHGLVRIVAAEALYRAASLLAGHPYHRA